MIWTNETKHLIILPTLGACLGLYFWSGIFPIWVCDKGNIVYTVVYARDRVWWISQTWLVSLCLWFSFLFIGLGLQQRIAGEQNSKVVFSLIVIIQTWQLTTTHQLLFSAFCSETLKRFSGMLAARHLALFVLKRAAQLPARWKSHHWARSAWSGGSWQPCLLPLLSCHCLPSHFRRNLPGL